jgi:DNA-binding transcriptional regulator PaaX
MQPKTQELLNFLLWSTEMLCRPTFRNLNDSYESWAYRNGLLRQTAELERSQFLERDPSQPDARVYRLTEQGRLHALGGRDPQAQWLRPWDGRWRLVLFDVPNAQAKRRDQLRRYLRQRGFGCLQDSVWITPDPMEQERAILSGEKTDVESLLLLEARPVADESDAEIVAGAWDFERINRCYARYLKTLEERPRASLRDETAAKALRRWAIAEREAWLTAVTSDPLLPEPLLPEEYDGRRAWTRRIDVLRQAARQLQTFRICPLS